MWTPELEWWQIVFRAAVVYFAVVLAMRWVGRQSAGQRNALDLVLILIVANSVQNAMLGPDTSLGGGLIAAGTLFAIDAALSWLTFVNGTARNLFEGAPVPLIRRGRRDEATFRRYRITPDEEESALRGYGLEDPSRIRTMYLELDGSLSVVQAPATGRARARHRHRYRRRFRPAS
jgi:uncharacterized membrane protein YcaP (DUF421 family)